MDTGAAVVVATASAAAPAAGPSTFDIVFPLGLLLVIAAAVPAGMLIANRVLSGLAHAPRTGTLGKDQPYESGLTATAGSAGERFSVKFYLVAMLFLVFDIEVAVLYPWLLAFADGGWALLGLLLVFLLVLEVGFLYLWRKGALDWDR
jgi:NADH-quinone oxidoreductase subunit A